MLFGRCPLSRGLLVPWLWRKSLTVKLLAVNCHFLFNLKPSLAEAQKRCQKKKKVIMTHVLPLFEPLLRIQLNPGYFSSTGSAARSLLTFTWVPACPAVCRLISSISSPLLTCFISFIGLVNASSVGQEKHCSSLNLHYLNTVGQDLVFLQCKSRVESSATAL